MPNSLIKFLLKLFILVIKHLINILLQLPNAQTSLKP